MAYNRKYKIRLEKENGFFLTFKRRYLFPWFIETFDIGSIYIDVSMFWNDLSVIIKKVYLSYATKRN